MTQTVYGQLFDQVGLASRQTVVQGEQRPEIRRSFWSTPASQVRDVQPGTIPIDVDHDHQWIGEIVHLERRNNGDIYAVGHIADDADTGTYCRVGDQIHKVERALYWSAERIDTEDGIELVSAAVTSWPARTSARPLKLLPGKLDHRHVARERWQLQGYERELIERAAATHLDRSGAAPLIVYDPMPAVTAAAQFASRAAAAVEYRSAELASVDEPQRQIDLVIAPCESPAIVPYEGRVVTEMYAWGAFAGVEKHPERVRVNRDHSLERTVGVAVEFNPYSDEGLIGTIRLARTPLADESLELARAGCLDASAGFRVVDSKWEGRSLRRITAAQLIHVALTPEPAYADAAVLAVRDGVPA